MDEDGTFVWALGWHSSWKPGNEIIRREPRQWEQIKFTSPPCELEIGKYRMIPYIVVQQPGVPPQLIESLGEDVTALGENYLNIPFVWEGGYLVVTAPPS